MDNLELDDRLFLVIVITASIANTIGFLANAALFGWSISTWVCGICDIIIIFSSIIGRVKIHRKEGALLVLFILNFVEFPFLYYVFQKSTMVYLILGIVGILLFTKKIWRIVIVSIVTLCDVIMFILVNNYESGLATIKNENLLGATISSYIIVIISITTLIIIMLHQYELKNKELENLAKLDALTRLYNRHYLTTYLNDLITKNAKFSVALLDLDDFKQINDRFGHVFGDVVLQNFGTILMNKVGENGICTRYGGEEFMIVFPNLKFNKCDEILSKIQTDYSNFSKKEKNEIFTFSAGLETYHMKDQITKLFNAADEKLYQAKIEGKNKIIK